MAISNLTGLGKIDKHLYYYEVRFYSGSSYSGVFSFIGESLISDKNDLRQFILDKGEGNNIRTLIVTGSFINANSNGEKISFIRNVTANTTNDGLQIHYDYYASSGIQSGGHYFDSSIINIYRYSIS